MTFDKFPVLLKACEQELTAIYENVPGIVFYIAVEPGGEFRFVSVSRDFLTATGLSREQVVGSLVRDVIPPPSCDMVLNHYREAIRSGRSMRWEEESVYPSGQRYGEVAVTPLYDARGLATHLIGIVHDITERKRREEKRAEDLLEAAPDAMVVVDQTGRIVLVNAQTERLFGYQREEILGQRIEVLIPQRFHDEYQAHRTKLFSEPRVRTMKAQLDLFGLRRDGSAFPVEISLSPLKAKEGIFITSAFRDITDRKRAEEALRASEERLRLAQQAARIGNFERDVRTGAITWSEGLEALYGLLPDSLDGKTLTFFKDLIHPDDRERIADLIDKALKTGQPMRGEWRAIWPDGSVHWLAGRWQVLMDESGQPARVVGVNMDVTERKLAEEALRQSEERLRLAQWAAHIGTFDVNLRTGLDIWPPETEALYGLPPGGFGGTLSAFENLIHPDDRGRIRELAQEMMKTGQPTEAEWRVIWPDGSVHWIASRGQVLMDESGEPSRMLGVNMDVTERKRAEEALSDINRKLIESQEQERTRIARELHDDINQRLALLSVELEASQQNPPNSAPDVSILLTELRERINEISSDVQSLSHRLHSSRLEYLGIVAATRSFCRDFSALQNVEVDFSHDDIPRSIPHDVSLCLFRVLQEALHNAAKYSQGQHFQVRLSYSANQLGLTVSDHGVGFDPDSALHKGGLGLTSMKERVRLLNGTISIESKPMHGSTIYVRVPLTSEHHSEELAG